MSDNSTSITCQVVKRTCRICKEQFSENGDRSCTYHPESSSGETAQRWLPPGTKGGNVVHNFYSCCGGSIDSPGCCWTRHRTFDEPEDVSLRKPGMGIEVRLNCSECDANRFNPLLSSANVLISLLPICVFFCKK